MTNPGHSMSGGRLVAWLQLTRVSAVPSTITNILAAFLVTHRSWEPFNELTLLIICSALLYVSGMVLNDWHDVQHDRAHRPWRPIPSGRVSRRSAGFAYLALTLSALLISSIVSLWTLGIATALVAAIAGYTLIAKSTAAGPITMGGCRFLNILLGGSTATAGSLTILPEWPTLLWWTAFSLGVLITGLTWFARHEEHVSRPVQLQAAALTMVVGLLGYAAAPWAAQTSATMAAYFTMIVLVISLPILIRVHAAVLRPRPAEVQAAVRSVLKSLIFLDAAICFLAASDQLLYPLFTALLIVPAWIASRYISST